MDRRSFLRLSASATTVAALSACTSEPDFIHQAPTHPNRRQGARKGIGLALGKRHGIEQLDALDVDWFYTWGARYPAIRPTRDFVPMIWGPEGVRRNEVEAVQSELSVTGATELLGFNEPDHPEQADMSVATAVKYWPDLEVSGLRLGSPAPVHVEGDWFRKFMDEAASNELRVDFITMHSYASPDYEAFLNDVQRVFDRYAKPIWITEYAVADWDASPRFPSRHSEKEILTFMRETAVGLRAMPFVERFAWKTRAEGDPVMGASALFRKDDSLTPTGELYQSL